MAQGASSIGISARLGLLKVRFLKLSANYWIWFSWVGTWESAFHKHICKHSAMGLFDKQVHKTNDPTLTPALDTSLWRRGFKDLHGQVACNYTVWRCSSGISGCQQVLPYFLSNTRMLNLQTKWYIVLMNTGIWSPGIPKVL